MYAIRSYYENAADLVSTSGGNRYGWFASQELPFLAIDNSALTIGSLGSVPVVGGQAVLSLTGLAVGSHAVAATFIPSNCVITSYSIHYTKLYEARPGRRDRPGSGPPGFPS